MGIYCVRGLEHTFEGNFPESGKFPWTQHNVLASAGARHFAFRAASRAGQCAGWSRPGGSRCKRSGGSGRSASSGLSGHAPRCPWSRDARNIRRSALRQSSAPGPLKTHIMNLLRVNRRSALRSARSTFPRTIHQVSVCRIGPYSRSRGGIGGRGSCRHRLNYGYIAHWRRRASLGMDASLCTTSIATFLAQRARKRREPAGEMLEREISNRTRHVRSARSGHVRTPPPDGSSDSSEKKGSHPTAFLPSAVFGPGV